jgi:hypothetical protein
MAELTPATTANRTDAPAEVVIDDERTDTDGEETVTDVEEIVADADDEAGAEEEEEAGGEDVGEARYKNITVKRKWVLALFHEGELVMKRNVENKTQLRMRVVSHNLQPNIQAPVRPSSPVEHSETGEEDGEGDQTEDDDDDDDDDEVMGEDEGDEEGEELYSSKPQTLRQRALVEGDGFGELVSLQMDKKTKRKKELTGEQQQRLSEQKEKRRLASLELQEEEKRDTISKLLQKQTKDKSKDKQDKKRKASELDQVVFAPTVILYRSVIR